MPQTLSAEERAKLFQQAVEDHEKSKAAREEKKQGSGNFSRDIEEIAWMGLNRDFRVFRMLGLPPKMRLGGTDALQVFFSKIVDDEGKAERHVVWKPKLNQDGSHYFGSGEDRIDLDPDWILLKLYKEITSFKWKKQSEEERAAGNPGVKLFDHEESDAFKRVMHNKKTGSKNKYDNPFYPKLRAVFNVLDRHDMEWHRENNHTKLLTSRLSVIDTDQGGQIQFPEVGVPITCFEMIMENVVAPLAKRGEMADWQNLDIVVKKLSSNPWYEVRDATESKIGDAAEIASTAPLTDEEMEWERYDLDKIYQPSTYQKLHKHFRGLFQSWDGYRGTNYYKQLEELVEKEKEEFKEKYGNDTTPENHEQPKGTHTSVPSEEPKARRKSAPEEQAEKAEDTRSPVEKFKASDYPHLDKLTDADWKEIEKKLVDFKNGIPVWDRSSASEIVPCDTPGCKYHGTEVATELPDTVLHCPCCGVEYKV
jgi:hypothetical protein